MISPKEQPMQIAVLEGYRGPRRSKMARRKHHSRKGGKRALRKKMKTCARKHKVTSKSFWSCVRKGRR
jgi:hypothetical protein